MKVNKPISDAEVKAANFASGLGIEDLPRFHEYLSRNVDNPEELARVINSTAGKNEYFHMLKSAKDRELDDLLKQYEQFTDAKALKALDARYNKYLKKDFANGGLVGTPPTMYDPMKVDDIVASIDAPHNY
jgi:DNA-binding MurR/RpiR family transcriptional regulator